MKERILLILSVIFSIYGVSCSTEEMPEMNPAERGHDQSSYFVSLEEALKNVQVFQQGTRSKVREVTDVNVFYPRQSTRSSEDNMGFYHPYYMINGFSIE